jgi:uncharacterized protein (TIGR02271 family)
MAYEDWLGDPVADRTGRRYATLDALFVGKTSGRPEYAIVALDEDGRRVAVPLEGARPDADAGELVLPLDVERVHQAPAVRGEVDHIPPAAGTQIRAFFGLSDDEAQPLPPTAATAPLPPATAPAAPTVPVVDDAPAEVTLSREELVVDTQPRPVERVRLRKVVVAEEVTVTVTLHHEELRIEREPIDGPAGDGAAADGRGSGDAQFVDDTLDFVLMAEEPVVGKRVRPVERVRVHRDTVTEQRVIDERVRVERVEVDQEPITEERNAR